MALLLAGIPLVPLMGVLVCAFWTESSLLKEFYKRRPREWEAAGRPYGTFWIPSLWCLFSIRRGIATHKTMLAWLFTTPSWIAEDDTLLRRLRFHRWAVFIWNVGALAWFPFAMAAWILGT